MEFSYLRPADKPIDPDQQSLRLTNERFVIPEVLFHPSDVGIKQARVQITQPYTL